MVPRENIFAKIGHRNRYFRIIDWHHRVTYWKKRERRVILGILDQTNARKILDFGCNSGFLTNEMQLHTGAEVYGTDLNQGALDEAKSVYPNVKFIPLEDAISRNGEFDIVTMNHVLEHVDDVEQVLGIASRLLRPDGKLLITVPQERVRGDLCLHHLIYYSWKHRQLLNPHVRIVRKKYLAEMLKHHDFHIEDHIYVNFLPPAYTTRLFWPTSFSFIATCGMINPSIEH